MDSKVIGMLVAAAFVGGVAGFLIGAQQRLLPVTYTASNEVDVDVYVHDDKYITVDKEPVYIVQSQSPNVGNEIRWHLKTPGYTFVDTPTLKGIEFFQISGEPEFHPPPPQPDAARTTETCKYPRAAKGKFGYVIAVTKGGATPIKSDPTGMNN